LTEQQRHDQHRALALELEQAKYQATLAARRYEAVDPDNRLVAAELEARWNWQLDPAVLDTEIIHQAAKQVEGRKLRSRSPVADSHTLMIPGI
jgi:hypothetical protein